MNPEEIQNLEKAEKVVSLECHNCGSELIYSADLQQLECKHCKATRALPCENDLLVELPYSKHINLKDSEEGLGVEMKVFHCDSCGSEIAANKETVGFNCPFCGSDKVNEEAHALRVIRPAGIAGFKINKDKAMSLFRVWIKKGWFHPAKLKEIARLSNIKGIYTPFWTYDAETRSSWTADAGYYYYVTESYRDAEGNTRTRQVRKVRWVPASGYYEHAFDDVLVVGSTGISQDMIERVFPFRLEEVVNYNTSYIQGWNSEVYQKDVNQGFGVADQIMDQHIHSACASLVPGDTHRNLNVRTQKSYITFKHILLPVWVAGYTFKGKIYQFLVNGQSGKTGGSKPLSVIKIALLVVFILAIIGTLIFLSENNYF